MSIQSMSKDPILHKNLVDELRIKRLVIFTNYTGTSVGSGGQFSDGQRWTTRKKVSTANMRVAPKNRRKH